MVNPLRCCRLTQGWRTAAKVMALRRCRRGVTVVARGNNKHYLRLTRYGEQLDHLFGLFPREQVMIFFPREQVMIFRYRRLLDEPAQILDEICAFLVVAQGVISEVPRELGLGIRVGRPRSGEF